MTPTKDQAERIAAQADPEALRRLYVILYRRIVDGDWSTDPPDAVRAAVLAIAAANQAP